MDERYEVVIMGAGLSGLIAACYLAKHGAKTALVEKNSFVGGYCSSFRRNGFVFDSAAHSLGSCREEGQFGKIFTDFNVSTESIIGRADPSNAVVIGKDIYFVPSGTKKIIKEFQGKFPSEKNSINDFFNIVDRFNINSLESYLIYHRKFAHLDFKTFLNAHFKDERIKLLLTVFLGNAGMPAEGISSLSAIGIFKEFILDGGYFVKGGMQNIAELFCGIFEKYGGEIIRSEEASKIVLDGKKIKGVMLEANRFLACDNVISAIDARTTFFKLIGEKIVGKKFVSMLGKKKPSLSAFIVYLGVKNIKSRVMARTVWYIPQNGNVNKYFRNATKGVFDSNPKFFLCSLPSYYDDTLAPRGYSVIQLYALAPFISKSFWIKGKEIITASLINQSKKVLGDFDCGDIVIKDSASPWTLSRFTSNYKGACYGWASTMQDSPNRGIRIKYFLDGLYLTGHWAIRGLGQGGTPMVAYSGRVTAKAVLKKISEKRSTVYISRGIDG